MTLQLSHEELRSLLHLVSLGLYVADSATREESLGEVRGMQELAQKLYGEGVKHGLTDVAEYDSTLHFFTLTDAYDNESPYAECVRDFEEDYFWGELASMLTERDMRHRGEGIDPLTDGEAVLELQERYMDHFAEHGVERVHIIPMAPHQ